MLETSLERVMSHYHVKSIGICYQQRLKTTNVLQIYNRIHRFFDEISFKPTN